MKTRRVFKIAVMFMALLAGAFSSVRTDAADPTTAPSPPRLFSVSIEVRSLPETARFVTCSCEINFSQLLDRVGFHGIVDEHSIRLFCIDGEKKETEQPVQFTPSPQPRLAAQTLLPGTSPSVSYRGELDAGKDPAAAVVAGNLAWLLRTDGRPTCKYRLQFGVPTAGRQVQVPFPPANFRAFGVDGRATAPSQFPTMQLHPQQPFEGVVNVRRSGELLTTYHLGPSTLPSAPGAIRRPFLYPVIGPDGVPLTEFGKPHDPTASHAHHYSLWVAHASVGGKDFWSEKGGAIVHEQLAAMEDGPVFCRIVETTKWMHGGVDMMHERRTITAYDTPGDFNLIDVELEFTTPARDRVELGKTTFGFLAARVAQSMTVFDGGGEIINSHGDLNESAVHLKHADWIDQSGPIARDKWGGVSLFDHPTNPNHPTGFHCRNDGWACASFNMDAPYLLKPGVPLRLKYRVLLHRGDSRTGEVKRRCDEYAANPQILLGEARAD